MMSDTRQTEVIGLTLPLPCAVRADTAEGICGRPAWVGYVWRQPFDYAQGKAGGLWTVQPICSECVQATANRFGVDQGQPVEPMG